jgi:hypothetical protein
VPLCDFPAVLAPKTTIACLSLNKRMKIPVRQSQSSHTGGSGSESAYRPPPPWMQPRRFLRGPPPVMLSRSSATAFDAESVGDGDWDAAYRSGNPYPNTHAASSEVHVSHFAHFLHLAAKLSRQASQMVGFDARNMLSALSVALVFLIVLLPYLAALMTAAGNKIPSLNEGAVREVIQTLVGNTSADIWADHIVLSHDGTSSSVDIPATFHSRLNAELAPLMRQHAGEIWSKSEIPLLRCKAPETLIVSFSMRKSARLPAICIFEDEQRNESIRDIRDIRVMFPTKTSRHMMRVQIAEDRSALANVDESPRRYHSWGRFRGRFRIDLSDTAKIALQRYCGESDFDVDVEPLDASDVLLITVLELKRLHSLWTKGEPLQRNGGADDSMFRAVVSPLDLSPAQSSPIHYMKEVLLKRLQASTEESTSQAGGVFQSTPIDAIETEPLSEASKTEDSGSETIARGNGYSTTASTVSNVRDSVETERPQAFGSGANKTEDGTKEERDIESHGERIANSRPKKKSTT